MDELSKKSYRTYDFISRYTSFPYYYNKHDDKYIYGTTAQLQDDIGYIEHIIGRLDTFDSLALKYYNNPTLYWVICDFNKIQDPYTRLPIGAKVRIPSLSNISFNIDT